MINKADRGTDYPINEGLSFCYHLWSGPRQCGKTTTVRELFPEFSYANLDDIKSSADNQLCLHMG